MSNVMKLRFSHIDAAKGIGIILVIVGHHVQSDYIHSWIYSFHMPLFFVVSGLLYHEKIEPFLNTVLHKAKALLWPYFTFGWIAIGWQFLYKYILGGEADIIWNMKLLCSTYGNGPIWFLVSLFWVSVLFDFLKLHKILTGGEKNFSNSGRSADIPEMRFCG